MLIKASFSQCILRFLPVHLWFKMFSQNVYTESGIYKVWLDNGTLDLLLNGNLFYLCVEIAPVVPTLVGKSLHWKRPCLIWNSPLMAECEDTNVNQNKLNHVAFLLYSHVIRFRYFVIFRDYLCANPSIFYNRGFSCVKYFFLTEALWRHILQRAHHWFG